jgi:hypothetical protein
MNESPFPSGVGKGQVVHGQGVLPSNNSLQHSMLMVTRFVIDEYDVIARKLCPQWKEN